MLFSAIVVAALSFVSFSPLVIVVGDWYMVGYRGVYLKFFAKKTFPDTVQMKVNATCNGEQLVDYAKDLCEGLVEPTVGKGVVKAGLPKGKFPQHCPFGEGDFTVRNWEPPSKLLPPLQDGTWAVTIMVVDEGKLWYAVDFDATLKNRLPALGR